MLQIVASLIDAARGVIYNRHMFIVQATGQIKHSSLLRPIVTYEGNKMLLVRLQ